MAAFVNGNEYQVEPLQKCPVENCIPDQNYIKNQPPSQNAARYGFPIFTQRFKEWKSFAERIRNSHKPSILRSALSRRSVYGRYTPLTHGRSKVPFCIWTTMSSPLLKPS